MNENIKWVYDELKKIDKDYDLGDYEEFDSIMNADGESRKWVYEQLQNNGYDIGNTYEEFESYIVPKSSQSTQVSQPIGLPGNPYGLGTTFQPTTQVAQPTAQATQPTPQPQVVEQAKAINQEQASGKVTATPTAPSAPKAEESTPTAMTSVTPMVEAATPVAEQPKSVATEISTQETEQATTPLSVQRDMAEQKGEEVVTGVQEETKLPADEYWATHAKELGQLVPQAPQGYVVDNMPQFVTVGMLNNFYSNQYDAKVSGVIYNAIKRNMTKDGVEPTEEDIKAKIATMSEDAIANALNDDDKNAIYALKEEFKRADSNKSNASAMISKVIDATPEKDRKKEGEILDIPDNMLAEALSNVVNGTDKDLEEYIASEDYNKVYRKAIADWANVKELFGEEAYNNTINGTGLDQYVHLGSLWRKMFGFSNGTNYPKQYEDLVTSKMRDVYSAEDKKGALDNLYNAIGTIDSYIDIKNKLSQEELDAVLTQVNATIPWGSKLASWDDVFFYNHSKDAEVPYAMTAQARALMALNDYTDNVTMARANDGAIKTLEEQIQKRAEENRAKAQEQVNANPLKYSNEILLAPNSYASNFGMDTEYDYLNSALEIRKEAKEYRDNASADEGFVANLWRGLTDKALDLDTWDFGLGEFKEAGMLMAITNKSDRGEALTAGEEAFLDAIATRLATFATTKATKGYSTGASTAESLAFMLEFAITPIKGGGALANKFARMMIAKYGKAMARKQAIKYSIGKGLAYVGGDLVKAGGMTATTGLPSIVADAMMRNIGDVSYTQMNDGSIVALRNNDGSIKTTTTKKIDGVVTTTEGGESWGTAIKNAFLSRTATNMSEAIGAYLPGKAFAKTVGNKLGLSKLVKAYDKMSATDWAKAADRFFKKTQWNGFGQEYIEELVDGTLQALITQDTSVSDVFEAENLIDTALAVGVMSVLMSGAKTMGYRTASHQLKQDINNTTITGQDLFGKSEWSQIQSAIDGSTADNMSANVQSLINNNELSAPQKKTILRYAMQVAERDALLTNEDKQALAYEGETNIDNTARLQASAYQGYQTTDTQDQFIVNQQYIEKGKAVANMLGGEDADQSLQQRYKTNGSYELADKVSHDTSLDVKQKQTILDYLGAKEKVASMGARAQNDINNATINVGREVERKSNIQTGDILTATHKYDGKQYYVIDGNVVTNQDGSINLDETTDDIIVEDAESGERMMMSPKMFAEAQLKPSGIKDAMREELNRRAEAYNNTIKYGHTLAVGSNITLRNAEGVDENKTIASVDNNAGVVTFVDGTTTTLNAIAEDARLRYSNQYPPSAVRPVVATKEEAQAENVGEPVVAEVATTESVEEEPTAELEDVATPSLTQTPTEYNQEEQVVFIDDNGTRIEGEIVSEVDADGKVLIEGADGGIHQVATSQIVERIGTTPVAEAQGDNNVEPTTDAKSEASSQEILDNSNEVGTTTPTAETPTQSAPLTEIPTDEKGKKQYEQASVEDTINDIYNDPELDEEDADAYVQARIDGASKRIAQLEKKKPKMGEDIPGFKAERAKWREQLEAQQASLAYWQGVQAQRAQSKATPLSNSLRTNESTEAVPNEKVSSTPSPKMDTPKAEPAPTARTQSKGNTTGLVDTPASRSLEVEERTMLNRLAKALGVEIEVVPTMAEANAKIVGNKITLALDAEQGAKKALGHELLHRIKALSPEAYEEFAQVIEAINPRAFEQAMIDVRLMYSRAGRTISRETLREEVVADMAGELMYNADLMERFVDALETKSFKEQILNVIKSVFDAIKGIFKGADARAIAKAERVLYNAMKRANMVVNQGNTTEADSANEKLSIIGERGASALDKAEEATHRMENLDMARKMERYGYPTKSIRMATGWERGADGKWRYEIEDIKLKKEWEPYLWGEGVKLSEIVVGGELFKAYPELKNLTIRYDVNTQSLAYLDWEEQLIGVNPYNLHDSYPSVVHEIQHAIQEIEGFAKGGNSTMLNDRLSAQLNSLTATINKLRAEGKNKEVDAIQKRYRGLAEAVINNSEDDYGNYRKLGGEVEARNVQSRIGMTPKQRRATLLAETEDVARKDQIFLMENSGVSAMGSTVVKRKADIAVKLHGKNISPTQLKVVDAFTTDVNNIAIDVVDANGKQRNITLKQGQDNRAGVKHSVLKHYETASNFYSAEDILLIPQIIEQGERKQDGKKVSYKLGLNGVTYSVTTEINNRGAEVFTNFYTNRSGNARSSNTQLSAQADSTTTSTDKGSDNIGDVQEDAKYSLRSNSPFYSNAEFAVENIKQGKATPEQWLAMIQKNGGLKAGEDKWLGLSDWLKASDAKTLTKEEVLDFIKANQIVVEEVRYDKQRDFTLDAQAKKNLAEKWGKEFADMFARAFNVEYDGYDERVIATPVNAKEALALYNEAHRDNWELYEDGTIPYEVIDDVEDWALTIAEGAMGDMRVINRTRLDYTTEGLENKREIALVVPTINPYNQSDEIHFGDAGSGRAVAWVRFGETTDAEGNRVLVIDEIQSKRHQDGREKGYQNAELEQKIKDAREAYIEAEKAFNDFREEMKTKYNYKVEGNAEERRNARKAWKTQFTTEELIKYDTLHDKVIDARNTVDALPRSSSAVPDAPFEKNWHELAMKRMLRYAAENGYDKVAWTTGEQQVERYNLGNSISKISVSKSYDGANKVISFDYRNPEGYPDFYQSVVDANGKIIKGDFVGNMLSDVVGKELATKLMKTEEGSISGDNLRLGGEGMKGFYDKMLPSFMNKYGKKWGVKVGEVTMPELQEGYQTMHSIDVTDAMKESVMEGQPLFSLRSQDARKVTTDAVVEMLGNSGIEVVRVSDAEVEAMLNTESLDEVEFRLMDIFRPKTTVYHGSGAEFERFDHSKMGEGEGVQAFGWGTYVTESEGIGRHYAKASTNGFSHPFMKGMPDLLRQEVANGKSFEEAKNEALKKVVKVTGMAKFVLGDEFLEKGLKEEFERLKAMKSVDDLPSNYLYTVKIPRDNGSNYLHYDDATPYSIIKKVKSKLAKILKDEFGGNVAKDLDKVFVKGLTGKEIYTYVKNALDGDKQASIFFSQIGVVGMQYSANYLQGGNAEGQSNYVIFNEADAKIADRVEFLKTPQGEVYGWTDGKKVYLTEKGMNPETPIHEYTHIWARAMKKGNAEGWQSVKDLLRDTPMWNEVLSDANYADIRENEDAVASEVLSRLSGKENAKRMESEAQRMIDEAKGVFAKAEAITLIERMRKALNEFWSWVGKSLFDIKEFGSIEEVTDRVLYDLVNNTELGVSEGAVERMVSTDIDKLYPNWLEGTTTDSGKHSTQVAGTRKTYNKVGDWIEENLGKDVAILDASSGMGLGTADLRERGFNIEDVEPYQSEERKQNNPATYSSYDDIDKEYDFIISNAVLNVIPDDWRSNVLHDMAKRLKEGGRLFINTRKAGEEKSIKDKIELDSPQEVLVKRNGKIASYQRFFTPQELKSWVESELGKGYEVEVANMKNSGTSGLPAVVVTKVTPTDGDDTKFSLRSKGVLHPDLTDTDGTRAKYNERVGSSGFKWREGYQDSMLSLKVLQEIIAEKHGLKEIPSWQNAYVEENEMSSRNKAMSDMYQRDFFKPLMAEVKRLIDKEGLKYEDIVTYLMAKHGLERNAVKAIEAAEQLADESMPKSADGKIDRDSNAWKSAFNEAYQETSKRDFSGLRGLFKTADVKIATGNAQMVVERMEQAVDTNALWNAIRSATNETLDIQRKGGLISKATYETLRDKYQFYIPLRGFNEKTAKDEYEYLTSSTPLLPPTMKRAKGRASMADDPLAHIGMLADSAIIQANRNKMKQAFYHFVVNNPSSVVSVSEQWYVRNETTGRWESRNPIIPNGASADEMAEILTQFEAEMKELASNKKARRKRGDIKTDFITLPYQASEHEVRVKINGRDYTIYINGNPRAAQALNGLTNPEQFNDIITKGGKVINNFMAQMFTSKNPAFIVTNMARDLQWATNAVMVKEGFAYQKEYFKSLAEATKVLTMIAKHNKGILDMNDKTQRYFEEFLRYGGETGYTAINQIEEYKKNVERLVKDAKGMTTLPAKSWHALVDGVEYLNRSAEDFTRFAVYMASREMGRTPERSAHDAKEITVNFNKKGSGVMGARYFSAAIIFFNASLQSLNNMARMFKHHPIKMSGAMSLPALVGFALPAILKAWMGDDDDEMYNNLPDWVRRNNIVLPIFGNTFLTIPLPHEMRPFYTMGTVAYDVIFNGYDAIEGLRDVALGFADMLPIDFAGNGGNIFVNMTPTFFQPVAQIMANVDYFGKPIYKKSEFYENDPEHSIAFKGTSPILIEASRLINAIGGGNDYRLGAVEKELGSMKMLNNPDVWEHLIDSYFGGVGKTAMRTIKTAQIIYGEALELFGKENKFAELNEVRNYPVLSSFIAGGEERTGAQYKITEQYYELLDKAKDYKEDLGDYKRAAIHDMKYAEELVEFMNTPEAKEARVALGYDTYRNILKKHLDLVDERRLDEINRAMADAMQEMQEAVKNAQSMTNEEILKKNSELVGKAKDLIYQEGDSVLDKNKGRLALLDAAVKYNNVDILEELLNNEQ